MQVHRYEPLIGSLGEPLWLEGERSYVEAGRGLHAEVTRPPVDLIGWCAVAEGGELMGLQACRLGARGEASTVAHGLLSWVRPAYRRRGVFAAIQAQVEEDLLARGITAIRSWVVEGPDEAAMVAAILARGGMPAGVLHHPIGGRAVRYSEFIRPIPGG